MNQILIFSLRSMPQPFVFIFSLPKVSCIVLMFCLKIRQTTNLILVQCQAQGQTFALQKWNFKSYFLAICTLKDMQGRFSSFQFSLYCTAKREQFSSNANKKRQRTIIWFNRHLRLLRYRSGIFKGIFCNLYFKRYALKVENRSVKRSSRAFFGIHSRSALKQRLIVVITDIQSG